GGGGGAERRGGGGPPPGGRPPAVTGPRRTANRRGLATLRRSVAVPTLPRSVANRSFLMDAALLRQLLFQAVAVKDDVALEALCRRHEAQILELFPSWRTVPEPLRDRPAEAQKFIESVVAVARVFQDRLGKPALMQSLIGDPKDNPLVRWQEDLEAARKEMDGFRYKQALERLQALLTRVQ